MPETRSFIFSDGIFFTSVVLTVAVSGARPSRGEKTNNTDAVIASTIIIKRKIEFLLIILPSDLLFYLLKHFYQFSYNNIG